MGRTASPCAAQPAPPLRARVPLTTSVQWRSFRALFQGGRILGYATMGGVAAASMQSLGWLSGHAQVLRPVWTLFHVGALMLGLILVWQAKQPIWLEQGAKRIWQRVSVASRGLRSNTGGVGKLGLASLGIGALWAFMPCGLLYSALLVAALAGDWLSGAAVMAAFAIGSSLSLIAAPWLWLRLREIGGDKWPTRLAGAVLAATSGWAVWMGVVHGPSAWCITQ